MKERYFLTKRQLLLFVKKIESIEDTLTNDSPDLKPIHKLWAYLFNRLQIKVLSENDIDTWTNMIKKHNL